MDQSTNPADEPETPRYTRERVESGITRRIRSDGSGSPAFDVQVWADGSAASKTFGRLADARRWRDEMRGERAKGRTVVAPDRKITVAGFVEEHWQPWLDEEVHLGNLKPSTASWYRQGVRLLVSEVGGVRLSSVGKRTLRAMLSRRVSASDSPSKLRHLRVATRSVLSLAVERDFLQVDPSDFMVGRNAPSAFGPTERAPRSWSRGEARRFLEAIEGDWLEALWVLLLGSGLRRGEALALRWDDVEFDDRTISVTRSLVQVDGVPTMSVPKSASSVRTIQVGASVIDTLRRHRRRQAEDRLSAPRWLGGEGLIFTDGEGSPLQPDYVTRRLKKLVTQAGLPWIRLHGLRHTMASLALQNGTDIATVSQRLGHSDPGVTTRIYLHGSEESDRAAADLLDSVLHGVNRALDLGMG